MRVMEVCFWREECAFVETWYWSGLPWCARGLHFCNPSFICGIYRAVDRTSYFQLSSFSFMNLKPPAVVGMWAMMGLMENPGLFLVCKAAVQLTVLLPKEVGIPCSFWQALVSDASLKHLVPKSGCRGALGSRHDTNSKPGTDSCRFVPPDCGSYLPLITRLSSSLKSKRVCGGGLGSLKRTVDKPERC
jgi:hypothetical protein